MDPTVQTEQRRSWDQASLHHLRQGSARKMQRGTPLYEQVHELLWTMLVKGEIQPLDHLSDIDWARRLGTSRTPVREALRKMEHDGILRLLPRGGYEVRALSRNDAQGLLRCCAVLEGLAADVIAMAQDRTLEPLREIVLRAHEAHDIGRHLEAIEIGQRFHDTMVSLSRLPYLAGLHRPVRRLLLMCEGITLRRLPPSDLEVKRRSGAIVSAQETVLGAMVERDGSRAAHLQGRLVEEDGAWWSGRMTSSGL
jgi:DNA-binding GntR family transcriptional regulator